MAVITQYFDLCSVPEGQLRLSPDVLVVLFEESPNEPVSCGRDISSLALVSVLMRVCVRMSLRIREM